MSRVYIIQIPKKGGYCLDTSPALGFGEIVEPCFTENVDISKGTNQIMDILAEYLIDFSEDDYIIQTGEHTLFTAACITASLKSDTVNILKWDRNILDGKRLGGKYVPIEINIID